MKLLQKTFRLHALVTLLIMIAMGVTLYFGLHAVVEEEVDEQLMHRVGTVFERLSQGDRHFDPSVRVEIAGPEDIDSVRFRDVMVRDREDGEYEPYREVSCTRTVGEKRLAVSIRTSMVEWDDLSELLFLLFLISSFTLVAGGFAASTMLSRKLWKPFFTNLEQLKRFSALQEEGPVWAESRIEEFTELRAALEQLTSRVRTEYMTLKEFTENASHEMQTPLTIISSKLEQLRQHPGMDSVTAQQIDEAGAAVRRLARLHRGLLLLAGIENSQYRREETVNMSAILAARCEAMEEIFASQGRVLTRKIESGIRVKGNQQLYELLVDNLLSNAVRHAEGEGNVTVWLRERTMSVSNPGTPLPCDVEQLFIRFRKGRSNSQSNGLGLAIVHTIVEYHGWKLSYRYTDGRHIFSVHFAL